MLQIFGAHDEGTGARVMYQGPIPRVLPGNRTDLACSRTLLTVQLQLDVTQVCVQSHRLKQKPQVWYWKENTHSHSKMISSSAQLSPFTDHISGEI